MKPQNVSACHPRTCLIPLRVTLPFPSPFSQFSLRESLSSSTSFIFAFLHFISTPFIDFAFSVPAFSFHAAEPTSRPFLPYPKLSRVSPILSYPTLSYPIVPYPIVPYPIVPYPIVPYCTLPYSTLFCSILPYPILSYLMLPCTFPLCSLLPIMHASNS